MELSFSEKWGSSSSGYISAIVGSEGNISTFFETSDIRCETNLPEREGETKISRINFLLREDLV